MSYELNDTIDWNKLVLFRNCNLLQCETIVSSVYDEWAKGLSENQQLFLTAETAMHFYTLFTGFWRNEFPYTITKTSLSRFVSKNMPSRHIGYWYLMPTDNNKSGTLCIKIPLYLQIKNVYQAIEYMPKHTTIENPMENIFYIQKYLESYIYEFLMKFPPPLNYKF